MSLSFRAFWSTVWLLATLALPRSVQAQADTLVSDSIRVVMLERPVPMETRQIPDGIARTSIILINSYSQPTTIELSNDLRNWRQQVLFPRMPVIFRVEKPKYYIRIRTDAQRIKQYSLLKGKRYQVYWSKAGNLLDLDPVE